MTAGKDLFGRIKQAVSSHVSSPESKELQKIAREKAAEAGAAGLSAAKDLGTQAIKSGSAMAADGLKSASSTASQSLKSASSAAADAIPTPAKAVAAAGKVARSTQRTIGGFILLACFAYGAGTSLPYAVAEYMKYKPPLAEKEKVASSLKEEVKVGKGWALPWGGSGGDAGGKKPSSSKVEESKGYFSQALEMVGVHGGKVDVQKGYFSQAMELLGIQEKRK